MNNFVNFETAIKLKNFGFDIPCLAFIYPVLWTKERTYFIGAHFTNEFKEYFNSKLKKENIALPLYQQVIEFFKKEYNCYIDSESKIVNEFGKVETVYNILMIKSFDTKVGYSFIKGSEKTIDDAILKAIELLSK